MKTTKIQAGKFVGLLFIFFFVSSLPALAQQKFWVLFRDKKGVSFDPYQYFDARTIARRQLHNLPLTAETDKPLQIAYVSQLKKLTDSVTTESRWFNAVACFATPAQVAALQQLSFVKAVLPMPEMPLVFAQVSAESEEIEKNLKPEEQEILKNQTATLGAQAFKAKGLDGSGVRIAVFDAGFKGVDKNPAFAHLQKQKQVVKTWDFVKNAEPVYDYATHGTMVLSCIGGKINDLNMGLATGAEFLLARTERMHSEKFSEEEYWVAALEWADKNGADIINSSLGYTHHRYFRNQMDGKTSLVSRAAEMAFEKGMLVVNAAGNDGDGDWKNLGAPADAENVLTVGGIDPKNFLHASFSSYGPTADKRRKPNVSAFGIVMAAGARGVQKVSGTSFASPLVAGFAACAWQFNRQLSNKQLFQAIEGSAHLFPYYDYAHGFGMPQATYLLQNRAGYFDGEKVKGPEPTFEFETHLDQIVIRISPAFLPDAASVNQNVTELQPGKFRRTNYLYYHIQNPANFLDKYVVVEVEDDMPPIVFKSSELQKGSNIQVHYKGYTQDYDYRGF